jgi:aspartate dehydrogenase
VRAHRIEEARAKAQGDLKVTDSFEDFVAGLDVVVEVAGHAAVAQYAQRVLHCGLDLVLLSVGCLADDKLYQSVKAAALEGGSRLLLPVGAIAGLDGLLALRRSGLRRVRYTSTKPPTAWMGTPAEARFDLHHLTIPTVIFSGTAREAATLYPRNANLSAAVALAGLGFDATQVDLVADPGSLENIGRIEAESASSRLTVAVAGSSEPGNPKTSKITGMSVLSALENQVSPVGFF